MSIRQAAVEAARERLRPILMTSFAFILGVLPLMIATGAGAMSRHSIGTGVFAGMLFATTIGIFFIPLFFQNHPRARPKDVAVPTRSAPERVTRTCELVAGRSPVRLRWLDPSTRRTSS